MLNNHTFTNDGIVAVKKLKDKQGENVRVSIA